MKHVELLAKIEGFTCCSGAHELALRAVVELHPMWTDYRYTETSKELVEFCGCCQEKWPCKTIQVIQKELQ